MYVGTWHDLQDSNLYCRFWRPESCRLDESHILAVPAGIEPAYTGLEVRSPIPWTKALCFLVGYTGFEPASSVWKTEMLPLHQYLIWRLLRDSNPCSRIDSPVPVPLGQGAVWGCLWDSNPRLRIESPVVLPLNESTVFWRLMPDSNRHPLHGKQVVLPLHQ